MAAVSRKRNHSGSLRAIILIAAIASLCVSEGVGLQLLPLSGASAAENVIDAPRLGHSDLPTRAPQGQSASRKIEIAAPAANRVAVEQQTIRLLSDFHLVAFELPDEVAVRVSARRRAPYRPPVFASHLSNRAPPTA